MANNEHPKPASRKGMHILSAVTLAFTLLSIALFAIGGALAIPHFREVFMDFDTELPTLTVKLVSMPPAVFPVVGVALAVVLILKEWLLPNAFAKLAINVVMLVLSCLLFALVVISLFLPLSSLTSSVQG